MQRLRKLKVTKRTKKSKVPLETLLKVHYNEEDDRPLLNVESVPENKCCYGEQCGFCPDCVQETRRRDDRDESNQSPDKNASSRNISPSSSNLEG